MSVQVKRRRESATFLSTFVGAAGELIIDTTNNRVLVQDGLTPGGFPLAKLSDIPTGGGGGAPTNSPTFTGTALFNDNAGTPQPPQAGTVVQVAGANGVQARMNFDTYQAAAKAPGNFIFRSANGTAAAPSALLAGMIIGQFSSFGFGLTTYGAAATGQVRFTALENWTDAAQGTGINFVVTPIGAVSNIPVANFTAASAQFVVPLSTQSANGATSSLQWIEQIITLSGPTTAITLPFTGIMQCVSLLVLTAVTGAASITVNDSQNGNTHWGNSIGVTAGTTNAGVASPGPYFPGSTVLALAAVGGGASFTGGTVRVSVLMMVITPPTS